MTSTTIRALRAVALAVGIATTPILALAGATPADSDGGIKQAACKFVSCAGGTQDCATLSGTIEGGGPFISGEIEVIFHCHEPEGS